MRRTSTGSLLAALLLTGCSASDTPDAEAQAQTPAGNPDPAYEVALSEPVEDTLYPDVGDPGVDALHYDLDLTWDPETSELTGVETLTFRSTTDNDHVQLDLAEEIDVTDLRLDGEATDFERDGKNLVVEADVVADRSYVLELEYAGIPGPVAAPTTRSDSAKVGWTTMSDGTTWTMQEPYGAYTWYAVNDHPSDKALYDFTLRVPDGMVGVANGALESRETEAGQEVTEWHLAEPASSYLVTVAFGDYRAIEETSASGTPVTIWYPSTEEPDEDTTALLDWLRETTVGALDWSEEKLGPYPFDSLGFLIVYSKSGMETQTMITLGLTRYTLSYPVQVHEVVHQWWGNQVTPRDWRDLWMSEGMTMYLQVLWEDENGMSPLDERIAEITEVAQSDRARSGPPAAYDADAFAERNVYYLPLLMWHDIRGRIGDEEFFRLVREWPASHDNENAGYDEITQWWEDESGVELTEVFRSHLLDTEQPTVTP